MEQAEYARLKRSLSDLTRDQAAEVRRLLAHQIGMTSVGQQSDWLLAGILEVLRERGLGHAIPPHFAIRRSRSFGSYETRSDRVRQLLHAALSGMTLTETRSIGVIAARCLAEYIDTWDKNEITLDKLLFNVGQIPAAMERAFPGYIDSNVLGFLLRRKS